MQAYPKIGVRVIMVDSEMNVLMGKRKDSNLYAPQPWLWLSAREIAPPPRTRTQKNKIKIR